MYQSIFAKMNIASNTYGQRVYSLPHIRFLVDGVERVRCCSNTGNTQDANQRNQLKIKTLQLGE